MFKACPTKGKTIQASAFPRKNIQVRITVEPTQKMKMKNENSAVALRDKKMEECACSRSQN